MLTFDEATHQYAWDGKPVLNVTRVLDAMLHTYDHVPRETLERARQQGQAIHKTIELHLANNVGHLPTWLAPYIDAWEVFVRDTGFVLEASERRLYHPHFQLAGTADLFGWLDLRKVGVVHVCIDLKRSFMAGPAIGLQTAAYCAMFNEEKPTEKPTDRIQARFALRFRPDVKPPYELVQFADRSDFATFCSMLDVYRYRISHGRSTTKYR